ncbi:SusD/RagB family nutrient-binding outer membrane lipoprotein [Mucilaginibacter sp.]
MKKTIQILIVLLISTTFSCTKNFTTLNTDPSRFTTTSPESVLTGVYLQTINQMETNNIVYLWECSHIVDPSGRYLGGNESTWTTMYINVLGNIEQIKKLYAGNPGYTNRMAIADMWECYVFAYLVGTYGPIPYSNAFNTSLTVVNYDDENTIYTSLLSRLKADAAAIKLTGDQLTTDVIFSPTGTPSSANLTQWIKFANTLRLRLALRVQHNLPALAASNIQDVMSNESMLPTSDADDAKFTYGSATGSQSVYYLQLNQSTTYKGTATPVMSDYAFTYFRSYNDPRLGAYFLPAATPYNITDTLTSVNTSLHYIVTYPIPYLGTPKSPVMLSQWGIITPPFSGAIIPQNFSTMPAALSTMAAPFYITTYAEVCFMKAEAKLNNNGGSQTADAYYYAGINANFNFWKLTPAQATAYEAQNGIKWGTAGRGFNYDLGFINTSIPADNATKIWIQEWLNYYDDGAFDAWALQRRTQNLVLPPHTSPGNNPGENGTYSNLNDRWFYPVQSEVYTNPVGYANGVKLLGSPGDYVFTHLKIEPDYTTPDWTTVNAFVDYSFVDKWYGTTIESLTAQGIKYSVVSTY